MSRECVDYKLKIKYPLEMHIFNSEEINANLISFLDSRHGQYRPPNKLPSTRLLFSDDGTILYLLEVKFNLATLFPVTGRFPDLKEVEEYLLQTIRSSVTSAVANEIGFRLMVYGLPQERPYQLTKRQCTLTILETPLKEPLDEYTLYFCFDKEFQPVPHYHSVPQTTPSQPSTQSSLFPTPSQPSTQSSLFPTPSQPSTQSSLFPTPSQPSTQSSLFPTPSQPSTQSSLFPTPSQPSSIFQQPSIFGQSSSNVFGQTPFGQAQKVPSTQNVFGQTAQTSPPPAQNNLFANKAWGK